LEILDRANLLCCCLSQSQAPGSYTLLIDQQSVGKRSLHLMDTVNAKMRWTTIYWESTIFDRKPQKATYCWSRFHLLSLATTNPAWWVMARSTYIPLTLNPRRASRGRLRYFSETPTFYQNDLTMRNTADVTGGKPITVWSHSISDGSTVNPLVAFYDFHRRERECYYFVLSHALHETYIKLNTLLTKSWYVTMKITCIDYLFKHGQSSGSPRAIPAVFSHGDAEEISD
jgi:hypothetical protein